MALSKRRKAAREKVDSEKVYQIEEALELVKELATAKFPESVDVSVNLGVDPRKSDQVVRGSTVLPNGTGKTVRVAVFARGPKAEEAEKAGADIVGAEDLIQLHFPDSRALLFGPLASIIPDLAVLHEPAVAQTKQLQCGTRVLCRARFAKMRPLFS